MADESTRARPRPSVGILLTRAGLRAREQELDQLRAAKRDDIGLRLREARGDVSISSPVGQALAGRRAGESVTVSLPDGRTRRLRIASVAPPT